MSQTSLFSLPDTTIRYCFLDLETTGFDHEKDSIIEISFIVCDEHGKEVDRLDELVIPHKGQLSPTVTRITGIEQSDLDTEGKAWEELLPTVRKKLKNTVIVGHNIDFDIRFLRENGVEIDPQVRIDTHELARLVLIREGSYALEVLSQKYGFMHTDAHRAMSDVIASKDLFLFLQEKIGALPDTYHQIVQRVSQKHSWYASHLFKGTSHQGVWELEKESLPSKPQSLSDDMKEDVDRTLKACQTSDSKNVFMRMTDMKKEVCFVNKVLTGFANDSQKSLLISPKLDFFDGIPGVPVPEILLDPEKLVLFEEKDDLSNGQVAFLLKCLFRSEIGMGEVFDFDLFFQEREWWKDVCIESVGHHLFEQRMKCVQDESIVRISPEAFVRFVDHPCLEGRHVVVDETEIVAERFLSSSTQKLSLQKYLQDDKTSVAAQFFVRNICKNVLEPLMNKQIGPYPERVVLPAHQHYKELLESAKEWADNAFIEVLEKVLCDHEAGLVRWIVYYPESGNMEFCRWHKDDWNTLKKKFNAFSTLFLHRHVLHARNLFGYIFLGAKEFETLECKSLLSVPKLVIPSNLVSAKDEQHISDTAQKITALVQERTTEDHWVGGYFTSQETLRKTFELVLESFSGSNIQVLGEKMAGGDGKLLEKMDQAERCCLCFQKILTSRLFEFPIKTFVLQKFPFPMNSPIGDILSKWLEGQDISWWDVWVVPQLQANLSRRVGQFPHLEEVICLDTRENSRWGKQILQAVFG